MVCLSSPEEPRFFCSVFMSRIWSSKSVEFPSVRRVRAHDCSFSSAENARLSFRGRRTRSGAAPHECRCCRSCVCIFHLIRYPMLTWFSLLGTTVVTSFCADYCELPGSFYVYCVLIQSQWSPPSKKRLNGIPSPNHSLV